MLKKLRKSQINLINKYKNWLYWRNIRKERLADSKKYFKVYYGIGGKPIEKIPKLDRSIIKEWLDRARYEKVIITNNDLCEGLELGDAMMQVYAYVNNLRSDQLRYGCWPAWQDMLKCEAELSFERNIYFKE